MSARADDTVLELLRQIRDEIAEEREERRRESEAARESRAVQHRRMDELVHRMGQIDTSIALSGEVDVQVRREIDALKQTVSANHAAVAPSVEEWKRIRTLGLGIVGLVATGGAAFGAALIWFSDSVVAFLRHWLGIH